MRGLRSCIPCQPTSRWQYIGGFFVEWNMVSQHSGSNPPFFGGGGARTGGTSDTFGEGTHSRQKLTKSAFWHSKIMRPFFLKKMKIMKKKTHKCTDLFSFGPSHLPWHLDCVSPFPLRFPTHPNRSAFLFYKYDGDACPFILGERWMVFKKKFTKRMH